MTDKELNQIKETTQNGTYIDINTHFRDIKRLQSEITHLQAEIERLESRNNFLEIECKNQGHLFCERVNSAKSVAIKEFAETLKFMAKKDGAYDYVSWHQIDSVGKEMTPVVVVSEEDF